MFTYRSSIIVLLLLMVTACDTPSWLGGKKPETDKLPGERFAVLPVTGSLIADEKLKTVPFALPPVGQAGNLEFSGTFDKLENAKVGKGESFEHPLVPKPVAAEGKVFVMDAVGNISAHDTANINTIYWQSPGVSEEDEPDVMGGGLAYDQGRLYATSGRGVVAAFEAATGKGLWKKSLRVLFRSSPTVGGGKLLAITIDSQLFALDAATGEILWSHRGIAETAGLMNSVSPAISGGDVIVPYASGEIYALSLADGRPLWNQSLSQGARTVALAAFSGIGGDPVIDGQVVFVVSSSGRLAVYGLATGQALWTQPIASINVPWISGDYLFVLTADNQLAALVKYDGRVRWSTPLPGFEDEDKKMKPIVWRGPILLNGQLVIIGSHGKLMTFSAADGAAVATKDIPEGIITAPVAAGGKLYMVSKDAKLYSLQ